MKATRCGENTDIAAVVLSGGLGTRLRSVLPERQKTVAPVAGRPFLSRVLEQIENSGIQSVVLCVGYLADQVEAEFGTKFGSLDVAYSIERSLLGTAGAVRFALDQVTARTLLVMNGDSYCGLDIAPFVQFHRSGSHQASMVITEAPNTRRFGRVNVDSDAIIRSFDEKGSVEGPGFINAGIYLFEREILEAIPRGHPHSFERDVFPKLLHGELHGYRAGNGRFIDIGTPETLQAAEQFFQEKGSIGSSTGGFE